jgi:hypothetical protein
MDKSYKLIVPIAINHIQNFLKNEGNLGASLCEKLRVGSSLPASFVPFLHSGDPLALPLARGCRFGEGWWGNIKLAFQSPLKNKIIIFEKRSHYAVFSPFWNSCLIVKAFTNELVEALKNDSAKHE